MFAQLTQYGGLWLLPVVKTKVSLAKETVEVNEKGTVVSENANIPVHVISLKSLSPRERAKYGWYEFVEENLGPDYRGGEPFETIENQSVIRTWPNKTFRETSVIRNRLNQEVRTKARDVMSSGMIHAGKHWVTDEEARNIAMLMGHKPIEPPFRVETMEGVIESMNAEESSFYLEAMVTHVEKTNTVKFDHLKELSDIHDNQELLDYDITTKWPENPVLKPLINPVRLDSNPLEGP
jgi:hypothetical protein